jgi:hypothetical protein
MVISKTTNDGNLLVIKSTGHKYYTFRIIGFRPSMILSIQSEMKEIYEKNSSKPIADDSISTAHKKIK